LSYWSTAVIETAKDDPAVCGAGVGTRKPDTAAAPTVRDDVPVYVPLLVTWVAVRIVGVVWALNNVIEAAFEPVATPLTNVTDAG
jgi:hypothetical protein